MQRSDDAAIGVHHRLSSRSLEESEPESYAEQITDFGSGSDRDADEVKVVPLRPASGALHEIRSNRHGAAANLSLQTP